MNVRLRAEQVLRLQELETEGGRLTPASVVDDARDPNSVLHPLFEWNDQIAAESNRLDRARELIRSVRVTINHEHVQIRVPRYIRSEPGPAPQGYRTIESLQRDANAARDALEVEFDRAAGTLTRARNLAVALGLEAEVDELLARLTGLREIVVAGQQPESGGESATM